MPHPTNRPAFPAKGTVKALASLLLALLVSLAGVQNTRAQTGLIRDAEIEGLLRLYAVPLFRAAGLNPNAVRVYLINSDTLNAFVANGQRIFVHTGLLTRTRTPNELIGVLAHETGHIAGGHLATLGGAMDRASTQAIIGMLLGAAAAIGGAAAGNSEVSRAGGSIMAGGSHIARANLLSYLRAQESAADQAAARYLRATKQSARGMLRLFERMASQSIVSLQYTDPYARSHPLERSRMRALETDAKKSPYFNKKDSPALLLRHELMQAKLVGFLLPRQVFRKYPRSKRTLPAHYARAIAYFNAGDLRSSLTELEILLKAQPKNPYFWELAGQAILNAGKPRKALPSLRKAVKFSKGAPLIRILLAQAMLATGDRRQARPALEQLRIAQRRENRSPQLHLEFARAYGSLGQIPRADLATAEAAIRTGDFKLAKLKAAQAKRKLKRGSTAWRRADDILNVRPPKKRK